ncbi:MAG: hypothetical protein H0U54_13165 [Acidobacteria bacterium]|nr:hypothetical protein [Acidobacteriota bacterium]
MAQTPQRPFSFHYVLIYKRLPNEAPHRVEIAKVYDRNSVASAQPETIFKADR